MGKHQTQDKNQMYMEDVGNISVKTVDFVKRIASQFETHLSEKEVINLFENKLFNEVFKILEEYCPNDYKNHI